MLHSSKVIKIISKTLKKIKTKKIILDPVMVAKGGAKLINKTAVRDLRKELIKNSYLITPNIPEAEILTNKKIKNINEMIQSAKVLLNFGAKNVLIKGGHRKSKYVDDIFLNDKEIKIFKNKRYITKNTHGTEVPLYPVQLLHFCHVENL